MACVALSCFFWVLLYFLWIGLGCVVLCCITCGLCCVVLAYFSGRAAVFQVVLALHGSVPAWLI